MTDPRTLSIVCQIDAVADLVTDPTADFSAADLAAICTSMKKAERRVTAKIGLTLSGPNSGRAA